MSDTLSILDHLLRADPEPGEPVKTLADWKSAWRAVFGDWASPITRALAGGFAADRPAWAFAAGYQAALQQLFAPAEDGEDGILAAFCVTENTGAHPSSLTTAFSPDPERSDHWRLSGEKTFVSGGPECDHLWVAATAGRGPGGRSMIRMARVPADAPGVSFASLPNIGFIPEMPHSRVHFDDVRLPPAALAPGDGYSSAVKPFRTIEDLHVTAAFLAFTLATARRHAWPRESRAQLLALVAAVLTLAQLDATSPTTHVTLAGWLDQSQELLTTLTPSWDEAPELERARWQRDQALLRIASKPRERRLERAWEALGE